VPEKQTPQPPDKKRITQSDMPALSLEKVLPIARAIWDNYAGESAPPHEVAVAIGVSPTSSAWRTMPGASSAYGLTEGAHDSHTIRLTSLGKRIVAPEEEGDREIALAEAAKRPSISKKSFERYDRKKLPQDDIGANVLVSMGLSKDKSSQGFALVKQNAEFANLILKTKTGPLVVAEPAGQRAVVGETSRGGGDLSESLDSEEGIVPPASSPLTLPTHAVSSTKVFISHGSDLRVVEQLKKAIRIAKLDPVVSVDRETTAKPVPDKVFDDMRSCFAGIIHVSQEGVLKDEKGNEVLRINENVLIEIGAAMALYKKNVILLVEKSVKLPSNLQGLYRCEYGGDELTADAFIKLMEAISLFGPLS
jgi:hypothetical protein